MRRSFRSLIPSSTETGGIAFAALLVVLLGNAKGLLNHYGLALSAEVVKSHIGSKVGDGLSKLDHFSLTGSVVTFAIWGVVGLITFSVLQAVLWVSSEVKYEEEVSSDQYVHPAGFSRQGFWRQIFISALMSFGLLILLAAAVILYLLYALPYGLTYARRFLLHASLFGIGDLLLGLSVVFVGTYTLYICLKLVVWHHRAARH